jgi:adenine-specific DNA-methyltransferase
VVCPSGRIIPGPSAGTYWRVSEEKFLDLNREGKVWWGKKGNGIPRIKEYLREAKEGIVPSTWWTYKEAGTNSGAKVAIREILGQDLTFITPKPVELVRRILEIATDKDSLVLDSFTGSGTTGHAVLDLNKSDGGNRRFILVEIDESVCQNVATQRLKRAVDGYDRVNGDKTQKVEPLGGGFRFCKLGKSLFDETGNIAESVNFADLAAHVFFTETGAPIPLRATGRTPLLGVQEGKAVYLLFNGVLGDRKPNGGNVLTSKVLATLPTHPGSKVIYGEGCLLSPQRLKREGIVFKQVPYEIKVS